MLASNLNKKTFCKSTFKTDSQEGWQDSQKVKALTKQTWWPELHFQNPSNDGRREPTSQSSPLISICKHTTA